VVNTQIIETINFGGLLTLSQRAKVVESKITSSVNIIIKERWSSRLKFNTSKAGF
jgi:hypothetical protein